MPKDDRPPAMLLYFDDFVSDGKVEAMDTKQVGAYFLLLAKAWREDPPGSIPNDDRVLARWARLTPDDWSECRTGVLAAFTLGTDDRWHQKRMRKEFAKLIASAKKRSDNAKRAASARWNERECDTQCESNADAYPPDIPKHAISSSSSFSNSIQKPSSSSVLDSAKPPAPIASKDDDDDGVLNWEDIQKRLSALGLADSRGAIRRAKQNGLSPKKAAEIIKHFQASPGKWPVGGLHWRIANGSTLQSASEGWPPTTNGPSANAPKKAKHTPDDHAMVIIREGRAKQLSDETIEAALQRAGLKWPA